MRSTIASRLDWLVYWHIRHRSEKLLIGLVWRLPKSMIRWAVVRAACLVEPKLNPSEVTAVQMLKKLEEKN